MKIWGNFIWFTYGNLNATLISNPFSLWTPRTLSCYAALQKNTIFHQYIITGSAEVKYAPPHARVAAIIGAPYFYNLFKDLLFSGIVPQTKISVDLHNILSLINSVAGGYRREPATLIGKNCCSKMMLFLTDPLLATTFPKNSSKSNFCWIFMQNRESVPNSNIQKLIKIFHRIA